MHSATIWFLPALNQSSLDIWHCAAANALESLHKLGYPEMFTGSSDLYMMAWICVNNELSDPISFESGVNQDYLAYHDCNLGSIFL